MTRPTIGQQLANRNTTTLLRGAPTFAWRPSWMGDEMLLIVPAYPWRFAHDFILARRAVQPAHDCEVPGIRSDHHSDARTGDRCEHHDLQLDQFDIAESYSRPGEPARGRVTVARPGRGQPLSVYLSRSGRHARR